MQAALQLGKRVLLVYDPTYGLRSSVDLGALSHEAPVELQHLLISQPAAGVGDGVVQKGEGEAQAGSRFALLPFPAGSVVDLAPYVKAILEAGDFADLFQAPVQQ